MKRDHLVEYNVVFLPDTNYDSHYVHVLHEAKLNTDSRILAKQCLVMPKTFPRLAI